MYKRDLSESNEDRIEQAARAILAAVYDPISTQANWPDADALGQMAHDRLMKITKLAVENWRNQQAPGDVRMHEAGFLS